MGVMGWVDDLPGKQQGRNNGERHGVHGWVTASDKSRSVPLISIKGRICAHLGGPLPSSPSPH